MTPALEVMTGRVYEGRSFEGARLHGADLSKSVFRNCNFNEADLSEVNAEGSDFTGSTFVKTNMRRFNGRNAKLCSTVFEPVDCFQITLTFDCKTFENMKISELWWFAVLTMWASMRPINKPGRGDLRDDLIGAIGAERYVKLKTLLGRREA